MKLSIGILMGGKSRRMGTNKAFLEINKKSFFNTIADELFCFDESIVSVDNFKKYDYLQYKIVEDDFKNIGPIEGIRQIIKHAGNEYIFICAVDMPFLKKELVQYMASFISSDFDCYVICDEKRAQPLCAIYSKKVLPIIDEMIKNKEYKLMNLISKAKTKYIELKYSCFDSKVIKNINTKEEFKKAVVPIIFCVSGLKNSGKTGLIIRLINEFIKEFPKIGVIKHDGHDFLIDYENTDTDKFNKSGSKKTAIFSNKKYALLCNNIDFSIHDIINKMKDMDMIIIEGMKGSSFPKVEVIRKEISNKSICSNKIIAVASDTEVKNTATKTNVVDLNNTKEIADIILNYFNLD